jgi:hypothetical protein
MSLLKAQWDGKVYSLDFDSITAREYKVLKAHTGLKVYEFERAILLAGQGIDVTVMDGLMWLFRLRAGELVDIDGLDDYSPSRFFNEVRLVPEQADEDEEDGDDPKAPPDDSQPNTSKRRGKGSSTATTATSGS